MKLKASIPSNSVKLIDLYNKITTDSLITGPYFQRKLVWKKQHKFAFIETILLNFPFPEIYIASSEVDVENLKTREVVVDGQQRLTTIVDYIQAKNDFSNQNEIIPFDELSVDEKKEFLNYSITVKDLKDIGDDNIREVFKRINSTNYSLNTNEILNAEFGGSEFAIFCKQLVDYDYKPNVKETDILIEEDIKNKVIDFFIKNNIFSSNDVKRMFDSQYIMLIISTFLEGSYFGRSNKINHYLEKYNLSFENYKSQLDLLKNSISIIEDLKFSENSYWFNKANLFTLLVELRNIQKNEIDFDTLETKLLELEDKVDIYFNGDENDIKLLTQDEIKYFEVARQGSHELSARDHRGKVIKKIIEESKKDQTTIFTVETIKSINLTRFDELGIKFSTINPTETGLTKSIFDAVSSVREFFKKNNIHNYESQEFGPTNKIIQPVFFYDGITETQLEISMYRSNGRGDYRMRISDIKQFVNAGEVLALIFFETKLYLLNISKINYENLNLKF